MQCFLALAGPVAFGGLLLGAIWFKWYANRKSREMKAILDRISNTLDRVTKQ
jgi:hypothetical protein